MKYEKYLQDIDNALMSIIGRKLSESNKKLARKLYNQRYSAQDAVSVLLTKI